jgi:hypothetical protein
MGTMLTIPKKITRGDELIVIRRQEYEQLQKHLAEVKDALVKIRKGEKELKEGKTRVIKSLSDPRSQGRRGLNGKGERNQCVQGGQLWIE